MLHFGVARFDLTASHVTVNLPTGHRSKEMTFFRNLQGWHKKTVPRVAPVSKLSVAMVDTEELPVGVGRVPKWWMEITPHYVLDREEDLYRKVRTKE